MTQTYQTDPLLHNYMAPSYPIFIQIKYLISGLNAKKSTKSAKSDIVQVNIIDIQLASKLGPDGQSYVISCLLEIIEIRELKDKPQSSPRIVFLSELLK